MINSKRRCDLWKWGSLALVFTFYLHAIDDDVKEKEEIVEFSPFTINASDNDGYRATSTLAGSRVNSNLRDLGASIAVVTQEFMEDIGATDGESLLSYVGNVEVGGIQGNFSAGNPATANTNDSRINPQSSQRVRGLESAALTRDYFNTTIGFDSYNTSRVTVNRGPNSILFGLGTSGGVINNTLSRARIGSNFGEISARIDHRGGHREILDYSKTLIKDRLAIRFSALHERIKFKQEPAFEKDERFFLAYDLTLSKNEKVSWLGRSSLRGSFETGEILRNPPDVAPPLDRFRGWFEGIGGQEELNNALRVPGTGLQFISNNGVKKEWVLGAIAEGLVQVPEGLTADQYASIEGRLISKTEYNRITREGLFNIHSAIPYAFGAAVNFNNIAAGTEAGWQSPELAGIQGMMGMWRPDGFPNQFMRVSTRTSGDASFITQSLSNRNVFDYHNKLWQGSTNEAMTEFDANQFFLEQELFGGNAGIELALDKQTRDQKSFTAFSSGISKSIHIDINSYQAPADSDLDGVPDRTPNENVARPITFGTDTSTNVGRDEQESFRATLFGTQDTSDWFEGVFGELLGSHTLTGLFEKRTNDIQSRTTRGVWWADQGDSPGARHIQLRDNDSANRWVISQVYLGPEAGGLNNPDDIRLDGPINLRLPQVGDSYGVWYWDDAANTGVQNTWRVIDSLQSANVSKTVLEAKAVSLQSHFLWNNLVAMYAVRKDEQESWRRLQEEGLRGPTGSMARLLSDPGFNETDGNFNEALLFLEDKPFDVVEGETTTSSIVGYYPEKWLGELPWGMDLSAHLYKADSIQPISGEVNVLNQPLASPSGITDEWGLTLTLLENRLSIRFNKFKTSRKNARAGIPSLLSNIVDSPSFGIESIIRHEEEGGSLFPSAEDALLTPDTIPSNLQRETGTDADLLGVNSFDEYYQLILDSLPVRLREAYNYEVIRNADGTIEWFRKPLDGALRLTQDYVAEGIEIDVVGRITNNWSLSLNIAQQETVTSNYGPVAFPLYFELYEGYQSAGLMDHRTFPFGGSSQSNGFYLDSDARRWRLEKAKEGTASQEQREWRINLVTRYDFREGFLKGFGVGASFRYQDAIVLGYGRKFDDAGIAIDDVNRPWLGPDELIGDLFLRYRKKLTNKLEWSVQFNARNLYRKNGNEDIPTQIRPDGRAAGIRIPNEQQFYLSNTFSF